MFACPVKPFSVRGKENAPIAAVLLVASVTCYNMVYKIWCCKPNTRASFFVTGSLEDPKRNGIWDFHRNGTVVWRSQCCEIFERRREK